jgi:hypothetical protein
MPPERRAKLTENVPELVNNSSALSLSKYVYVVSARLLEGDRKIPMQCFAYLDCSRVPGGQFAMGEEPLAAGCRFRQPRSVAMSETRLTKLATCLLLTHCSATCHFGRRAHPNAPSLSIFRSGLSGVEEERSPYDARGVSCAATCPLAVCLQGNSPAFVYCSGWTRASSMASRGATRGHRPGRPC